MKKFIRAAVVAAALSASALASATTYDFTYTFNTFLGKDTVSGQFDGSLVGDRITGLTDVEFSINGEKSFVAFASGYASLSGKANNFIFSAPSATFTSIGPMYAFIGDCDMNMAFDLNGWTVTPNVPTIPSAPVPEPETYAMMLGGLAMLGFMARRRKAK